MYSIIVDNIRSVLRNTCNSCQGLVNKVTSFIVRFLSSKSILSLTLAIFVPILIFGSLLIYFYPIYIASLKPVGDVYFWQPFVRRISNDSPYKPIFYLLDRYFTDFEQLSTFKKINQPLFLVYLFVSSFFKLLILDCNLLSIVILPNLQSTFSSLHFIFSLSSLFLINILQTVVFFFKDLSILLSEIDSIPKIIDYLLLITYKSLGLFIAFIYHLHHIVFGWFVYFLKFLVYQIFCLCIASRTYLIFIFLKTGYLFSLLPSIEDTTYFFGHHFSPTWATRHKIYPVNPTSFITYDILFTIVIPIRVAITVFVFLFPFIVLHWLWANSKSVRALGWFDWLFEPCYPIGQEEHGNEEVDFLQPELSTDYSFIPGTFIPMDSYSIDQMHTKARVLTEYNHYQEALKKDDYRHPDVLAAKREAKELSDTRGTLAAQEYFLLGKKNQLRKELIMDDDYHNDIIPPQYHTVTVSRFTFVAQLFLLSMGVHFVQYESYYVEWLSLLADENLDKVGITNFFEKYKVLSIYPTRPFQFTYLQDNTFSFLTHPPSSPFSDTEIGSALYKQLSSLNPLLRYKEGEVFFNNYILSNTSGLFNSIGSAVNPLQPVFNFSQPDGTRINHPNYLYNSSWTLVNRNILILELLKDPLISDLLITLYYDCFSERLSSFFNHLGSFTKQMPIFRDRSLKLTSGNQPKLVNFINFSYLTSFLPYNYFASEFDNPYQSSYNYNYFVSLATSTHTDIDNLTHTVLNHSWLEGYNSSAKLRISNKKKTYCALSGQSENIMFTELTAFDSRKVGFLHDYQFAFTRSSLSGMHSYDQNFIDGGNNGYLKFISKLSFKNVSTPSFINLSTKNFKTLGFFKPGEFPVMKGFFDSESTGFKEYLLLNYLLKSSTLNERYISHKNLSQTRTITGDNPLHLRDVFLGIEHSLTHPLESSTKPEQSRLLEKRYSHLFFLRLLYDYYVSRFGHTAGSFTFMHPGYSLHSLYNSMGFIINYNQILEKEYPMLFQSIKFNGKGLFNGYVQPMWFCFLWLKDNPWYHLYTPSHWDSRFKFDKDPFNRKLALNFKFGSDTKSNNFRMSPVDFLFIKNIKKHASTNFSPRLQNSLESFNHSRRLLNFNKDCFQSLKIDRTVFKRFFSYGGINYFNKNYSDIDNPPFSTYQNISENSKTTDNFNLASLRDTTIKMQDNSNVFQKGYFKDLPKVRLGRVSEKTDTSLEEKTTTNVVVGGNHKPTSRNYSKYFNQLLLKSLPTVDSTQEAQTTGNFYHLLTGSLIRLSKKKGNFSLNFLDSWEVERSNLFTYRYRFSVGKHLPVGEEFIKKKKSAPVPTLPELDSFPEVQSFDGCAKAEPLYTYHAFKNSTPYSKINLPHKKRVTDRYVHNLSKNFFSLSSESYFLNKVLTADQISLTNEIPYFFLYKESVDFFFKIRKSYLRYNVGDRPLLSPSVDVQGSYFYQLLAKKVPDYLKKLAEYFPLQDPKVRGRLSSWDNLSTKDGLDPIKSRTVEHWKNSWVLSVKRERFFSNLKFFIGSKHKTSFSGSNSGFTLGSQYSRPSAVRFKDLNRLNLNWAYNSALMDFPTDEETTIPSRDNFRQRWHRSKTFYFLKDFIPKLIYTELKKPRKQARFHHFDFLYGLTLAETYYNNGEFDPGVTSRTIGVPAVPYLRHALYTEEFGDGKQPINGFPRWTRNVLSRFLEEFSESHYSYIWNCYSWYNKHIFGIVIPNKYTWYPFNTFVNPDSFYMYRFQTLNASKKHFGSNFLDYVFKKNLSIFSDSYLYNWVYSNSNWVYFTIYRGFSNTGNFFVNGLRFLDNPTVSSNLTKLLDYIPFELRYLLLNPPNFYNKGFLIKLLKSPVEYLSSKGSMLEEQSILHDFTWLETLNKVKNYRDFRQSYLLYYRLTGKFPSLSKIKRITSLPVSGSFPDKLSKDIELLKTYSIENSKFKRNVLDPEIWGLDRKMPKDQKIDSRKIQIKKQNKMIKEWKLLYPDREDIPEEIPIDEDDDKKGVEDPVVELPPSDSLFSFLSTEYTHVPMLSLDEDNPLKKVSYKSLPTKLGFRLLNKQLSIGSSNWIHPVVWNFWSWSNFQRTNVGTHNLNSTFLGYHFEETFGFFDNSASTFEKIFNPNLENTCIVKLINPHDFKAVHCMVSDPSVNLLKFLPLEMFRDFEINPVTDPSLRQKTFVGLKAAKDLLLEFSNPLISIFLLRPVAIYAFLADNLSLTSTKISLYLSFWSPSDPDKKKKIITDVTEFWDLYVRENPGADSSDFYNLGIRWYSPISFKGDPNTFKLLSNHPTYDQKERLRLKAYWAHRVNMHYITAFQGPSDLLRIYQTFTRWFYTKLSIPALPEPSYGYKTCGYKEYLSTITDGSKHPYKYPGAFNSYLFKILNIQPVSSLQRKTLRNPSSFEKFSQCSYEEPLTYNRLSGGFDRVKFSSLPRETPPISRSLDQLDPDSFPGYLYFTLKKSFPSIAYFLDYGNDIELKQDTYGGYNIPNALKRQLQFNINSEHVFFYGLPRATVPPKYNTTYVKLDHSLNYTELTPSAKFSKFSGISTRADTSPDSVFPQPYNESSVFFYTNYGLFAEEWWQSLKGDVNKLKDEIGLIDTGLCDSDKNSIKKVLLTELDREFAGLSLFTYAYSHSNLADPAAFYQKIDDFLEKMIDIKAVILSTTINPDLKKSLTLPPVSHEITNYIPSSSFNKVPSVNKVSSFAFTEPFNAFDPLKKHTLESIYFKNFTKFILKFLSISLAPSPRTTLEWLTHLGSSLGFTSLFPSHSINTPIKTVSLNFDKRYPLYINVLPYIDSYTLESKSYLNLVRVNQYKTRLGDVFNYVNYSKLTYLNGLYNIPHLSKLSTFTFSKGSDYLKFLDRVSDYCLNRDIVSDTDEADEELCFYDQTPSSISRISKGYNFYIFDSNFAYRATDFNIFLLKNILNIGIKARNSSHKPGSFSGFIFEDSSFSWKIPYRGSYAHHEVDYRDEEPVLNWIHKEDVDMKKFKGDPEKEVDPFLNAVVEQLPADDSIIYSVPNSVGMSFSNNFGLPYQSYLKKTFTFHLGSKKAFILWKDSKLGIETSAVSSFVSKNYREASSFETEAVGVFVSNVRPEVYSNFTNNVDQATSLFSVLNRLFLAPFVNTKFVNGLGLTDVLLNNPINYSSSLFIFNIYKIYEFFTKHLADYYNAGSINRQAGVFNSDDFIFKVDVNSLSLENIYFLFNYLLKDLNIFIFNDSIDSEKFFYFFESIRTKQHFLLFNYLPFLSLNQVILDAVLYIKEKHLYLLKFFLLDSTQPPSILSLSVKSSAIDYFFKSNLFIKHSLLTEGRIKNLNFLSKSKQTNFILRDTNHLDFSYNRYGTRSSPFKENKIYVHKDLPSVVVTDKLPIQLSKAKTLQLDYPTAKRRAFQFPEPSTRALFFKIARGLVKHYKTWESLYIPSDKHPEPKIRFFTRVPQSQKKVFWETKKSAIRAAVDLRVPKTTINIWGNFSSREKMLRFVEDAPSMVVSRKRAIGFKATFSKFNTFLEENVPLAKNGTPVVKNYSKDPVFGWWVDLFLIRKNFSWVAIDYPTIYFYFWTSKFRKWYWKYITGPSVTGRNEVGSFYWLRSFLLKDSINFSKTIYSPKNYTFDKVDNFDVIALHNRLDFHFLTGKVRASTAINFLTFLSNQLNSIFKSDLNPLFYIYSRWSTSTEAFNHAALFSSSLNSNKPYIFRAVVNRNNPLIGFDSSKGWFNPEHRLNFITRLITQDNFIFNNVSGEFNHPTFYLGNLYWSNNLYDSGNYTDYYSNYLKHKDVNKPLFLKSKIFVLTADFNDGFKKLFFSQYFLNLLGTKRLNGRTLVDGLYNLYLNNSSEFDNNTFSVLTAWKLDRKGFDNFTEAVLPTINSNIFKFFKKPPAETNGYLSSSGSLLYLDFTPPLKSPSKNLFFYPIFEKGLWPTDYKFKSKVYLNLYNIKRLEDLQLFSEGRWRYITGSIGYSSFAEDIPTYSSVSYVSTRPIFFSKVSSSFTSFSVYEVDLCTGVWGGRESFSNNLSNFEYQAALWLLRPWDFWSTPVVGNKFMCLSK